MPGTLQLVTVNKTPQRIQTFMVQNDSFMLVNPDITNNIFIGNDPGSQFIAVPPLGSVTLDSGKHDIWLSTNGGNFVVSAYLMPNGSNWVPSPAQVAASINALGLAKDTTVSSVTTTLGTPAQSNDVLGLTSNGIPLLRGTTQLGNANTLSLVGNNTVTLLNAVTITKPSFEAVFQLNLPTGLGTIPFAILGVGWADVATGLQVGFKQYVLTAGNGAANSLIFYLSGPCRGNQLTLTLQNLEPVQSMTYSWLFNVISHIYTIDRLLQPAYGTANPIGFSNAGGNPAKGVLFMSQPSIGPSATITRLCAASNAKCKISIDNGAQANGVAVILTDPGGSSLYNGAIGQSLYRIVAPAGTQAVNEIQFPNGPLLVSMVNQAAVNTITPSIVITIMEY